MSGTTSDPPSTAAYLITEHCRRQFCERIADVSDRPRAQQHRIISEYVATARPATYEELKAIRMSGGYTKGHKDHQGVQHLIDPEFWRVYVARDSTLITCYEAPYLAGAMRLLGRSTSDADRVRQIVTAAYEERSPVKWGLALCRLFEARFIVIGYGTVQEMRVTEADTGLLPWHRAIGSAKKWKVPDSHWIGEWLWQFGAYTGRFADFGITSEEDRPA